MILKVMETFEQGLRASQGGTFKAYAGAQLPAEAGEGGAIVVTVEGKPRTLSAEIVTKITGLGLAELA